MTRGFSICDFCGSVQGLRCYPTGVSGVDWYACEDCSALIQNEDWNKLIDRSIGAYMALRFIPEGEHNALRQQVGNQIKAFRTFCLLPA